MFDIQKGDVAPSMASVEYWDEMYRDRPTTYDTLYSYSDIRNALVRFLRNFRLPVKRCDARVLHIGCGTSDVTEGLWRDGFRNICNIDFSEVVVDIMAEKWKKLAEDASSEVEGDEMRQSVQWLHMDAADLSALPSGKFHLLIEKFTLDAMLCESKDAATDKKGCAAVREFHRVLAPGGTLVSIAWGEKRRADLLRSGGLFDVDCERIEGSAKQRPLFYACRKKAAQGEATRTIAHNGEHLQAQPAAETLQQLAEEEPESPTEPPAPKASVASTLVLEADGKVEVWIDFGANSSVAPEDVELDIGENQLRFRLRGLSTQSGVDVWRGVRLPNRVDPNSSSARWTRAAPPQTSVAPVADATKGGRKRVIRITAPVLPLS